MSGKPESPEPKGIKRVSTGIQSMSVAAVLMMIGLLLSKLTGQLREILIVPKLGYGVVSDAFVIGFQIPDLFYQLLIGGAIQAVITPSMAAALERGRERGGWRSISIFINFAALAMLLAVLLGEILAPWLITLYNAGKSQEVTDLAAQVARALFPQAFFMMLAALCIGILNAYKKFLSTSFGPSVYNIGVVLAMLLLGQATAAGAIRVASGVMLAAGFYFILQFVLARREFGHYVLSLDWRDRGFNRLLRLAIPTLLSGSIVQINMIILTAFANDFSGAVTSLRQATTTWQLPYGVFAVAIGNVMLPSLAGLNARHDHAASRRLLGRSLRSALFLTIPAAALFLAMQQDVIRAIFQWGSSYNDQIVGITASILRWYCLAIVMQTVVFLINQAFYAQRQTRIALFNGLLTLVLNTLFCFSLTRWTNLGVSSLSLAYTLTSAVSMTVLLALYRRLYPQAAPKRLWPFLVRTFFCTAALLLIVMGLNALPIHPSSKALQLTWFFARSLVGFGGFLTVARLLKLPEALLAVEKLAAAIFRLGRLAKWLAGLAKRMAAWMMQLAARMLGNKGRKP